jgi:hypothetical protein
VKSNQDEHRRHGDHRRVRDAREGGVHRHEIERHGSEQPRHGHDVVPEAPPDEERERHHEQAGEEQLVEAHG